MVWRVADVTRPTDRYCISFIFESSLVPEPFLIHLVVCGRVAVESRVERRMKFPTSLSFLSISSSSSLRFFFYFISLFTLFFFFLVVLLFYCFFLPFLLLIRRFFFSSHSLHPIFTNLVLGLDYNIKQVGNMQLL